MKPKNPAHELLAIHLRELGLEFEREYRFQSDRKWRFDFAVWIWRGKAYEKFAIEIEGGVWSKGRHVRGKGFIGDMEKYNEAQRWGYKVYRFTTEQVLSGYAKEWLKEALK